MRDLAAKFTAEHLPRLRSRTAKGYERFIGSEILPAIGGSKVHAVSYADIERLHRKMSERAPVHANRCLATLSKMFALAIKLGWLDRNPCRGVARNAEQPRERYLSPDELAALVDALAVLKDRQAADVIKLLLLCGCRSGEALNARWEQFDLATGVWTKPPASTKQKRQHRVPLSEAAISVLRGIRDEAPIVGSFVFPAARGGGHRAEVRRAWKRVCAAAGLDNFRVHDCRHQFASALVSSGISLQIVSKLLGHSTIAMSSRYAHLADDPLREATERIGKMVTDAAGRSPKIVPLRPR